MGPDHSGSGGIGVETPEVLIDRQRLEANIGKMADAISTAGIGLRPHVKTHKILPIARMQLRAGAAGLTVATVGEAEVFVADGATDVFIAYPLWATPAIARRLAALAERARITVGADSVEGIENLHRRLGPASPVETWVEVDSGHHRSGVAPGSPELREIAQRSRRPISGVFTFPGHAYAPGQAPAAAAQEAQALADAATELGIAGHDIAHLSGGSTPSVAFASADRLTEVRPGVYALGDAQQLELGRCRPEDVALTVAATVVSRRRDARQVVVNAGSKVLGSDRPAWMDGFGHVVGVPQARLVALSEHHGTIQWDDDSALPAPGDLVRLIPNHVCLVPNLVDEVAVVEGGTVVDRWPVAARGRNG